MTIDFSCESVIIKTRNGWCRAKVRVCTRPGDCRDTLRNSQSVFRIVWRSEGKVYGSKKEKKYMSDIHLEDYTEQYETGFATVDTMIFEGEEERSC